MSSPLSRFRTRFGNRSLKTRSRAPCPLNTLGRRKACSKISLTRYSISAFPTLVLAGENDQVEKIDLLERALLPNIPTARMTIIPETGHLSPLEVPDKIASEIRAFLRG
jgi:pimeloyl-ACP methyl ester carboxylesterase